MLSTVIFILGLVLIVGGGITAVCSLNHVTVYDEHADKRSANIALAAVCVMALGTLLCAATCESLI